MRFLRVGAACVVTNDAGEILLSQRGDLKVWVLPGGRLDRGEPLVAAAMREVREETGIEAEPIRPVGLYYTTRWQRLTAVFRARAVGGVLLGKTHETLDNRFFPPDSLPDNVRGARRVQDALSDNALLRVYETPLEEYRRLRRRFARRYIENLLAGHPEPRHPRFDVQAVAVVWDEAQRRVLSSGGRYLPGVVCDGSRAPWQALSDRIESRYGLALDWSWSGVWQETGLNCITFVFAAVAAQLTADFVELAALPPRQGEMARYARDSTRVWQLY